MMLNNGRGVGCLVHVLAVAGLFAFVVVGYQYFPSWLITALAVSFFPILFLGIKLSEKREARKKALQEKVDEIISLRKKAEELKTLGGGEDYNSLCDKANTLEYAFWSMCSNRERYKYSKVLYKSRESIG